MNFLAVRHGWTNARTKAIAARKANSMPGGLSLMPTTVAAIADKPQVTNRISVLILLRGVEKISIMTVSYFDSGFRLWLPNGLAWAQRRGGIGRRGTHRQQERYRDCENESRFLPKAFGILSFFHINKLLEKTVQWFVLSSLRRLLSDIYKF
jgi:hypothetical protein